jgi:hypothetical protein
VLRFIDVGYGDTVQPGYLREFIQEEAPQQQKEKQGQGDKDNISRFRGLLNVSLLSTRGV